MQHLLLQEKVERFRRELAVERNETVRQTLAWLLSNAERELALYMPSGAVEFRRVFEAADVQSMLLDAREGIHIIDMNAPYADATLVNRKRTAGQRLFEVFPDNPGDPDADGVSNLRASLLHVIRTGQPHAMASQRYDVRNDQGAFEERHWQPQNIPIRNRDGALIFILHQAANITADVLSRAAQSPWAQAASAAA